MLDYALAVVGGIMLAVCAKELLPQVPPLHLTHPDRSHTSTGTELAWDSAVWSDWPLIGMRIHGLCAVHVPGGGMMCFLSN